MYFEGMLFTFIKNWEKQACILSYSFGLAKLLIAIKKFHSEHLKPYMFIFIFGNIRAQQAVFWGVDLSYQNK